MKHYETVDDTVWPVNLDDIEWALRYGEPTKEQMLVAASAIAAYRHLTDSTIRFVTAEAMLRRARTAALNA